MKLILKISITLLVGVTIFIFYASAPKNVQIDLQPIVNTNDAVVLPEKDTFSVITFNIGYLSGMTNNLPVERSAALFANNLDRAVQLINVHQPDIVGFQEIDFDADRSYNIDQLAYISEHTGLKNAAAVVNWNVSYVPFPYWPLSAHFGAIISGQAVASKYPILKNERIILQRPTSSFFVYDLFYLDRLIQLSTIKIGIKDLIVMNVHLEAWDEEVRLAQAEVVIAYYQQLAGKFPVLLLGDFNDVPGSQVYKTLRSASNIEDASMIKNKVGEDSLDNYTFDSEVPRLKIDYIFFNPEFITFFRARTITEVGDISDHLPVIVQFGIR